MKSLLRNYLIYLAALLLTTQLVPGFSYEGGVRTLFMGALGVMLINFTIVPLLKLMFLPLNLLTFGLFTWVINVLALYFLTTVIPQFHLASSFVPGVNLGLLLIPALNLNPLQVAVLASFVIGFSAGFMKWLIK